MTLNNCQHYFSSSASKIRIGLLRLFLTAELVHRLILISLADIIIINTTTRPYYYYDTNTIYLRALKSWRNGQLSPSHRALSIAILGSHSVTYHPTVTGDNAQTLRRTTELGLVLSAVRRRWGYNWFIVIKRSKRYFRKIEGIKLIPFYVRLRVFS